MTKAGFSKIMAELMSEYADDPKLVKSFRTAKCPEDLKGWAYELYMKKASKMRK